MSQLYHVYIVPKSDPSNSLTKLGLSREQLVQRVVDNYDQGKSITLSGRTIPPHDIEQIRISTSTIPVAQLLARAEAEQRSSSVVVASAGFSEYLAFTYGEDATDDFIHGPPGNKSQPEAKAMAETNDLKALSDLIVEGERIMGLPDFYAADRQYQRWLATVGAEIAALRLDSPTRLQWVNMAAQQMMIAQDQRNLQALHVVIRERLGWLGERLSTMKLLAGTPHQIHHAKADNPRSGSPPASSTAAVNKKVFVVHGHDHGLKNTVARYVDLLGLRAIILHEQPDMGRTIIEKFEAESEVGLVKS